MDPEAHFVSKYSLTQLQPSRYKIRYYRSGDKWYLAIKDIREDALLARIPLQGQHSAEVHDIIEELMKESTDQPFRGAGRVRIQGVSINVVHEGLRGTIVRGPINPATIELSRQNAEIFRRNVEFIDPQIELAQASTRLAGMNMQRAGLVGHVAPPLVPGAAPLPWPAPFPPTGADKVLGKGVAGQATFFDTGFSQLVQKIGRITRFEKKVLPYLDHPNIIKAQKDPHGDKIVLQAAHGITWYKWTELRLTITQDQYQHWRNQWKDVIRYMDQFEVMHNDLNGANIIVEPATLNFKIIDWGTGSVTKPFGSDRVIITHADVWTERQVPRRDWPFINYYFLYMAISSGTLPNSDWALKDLSFLEHAKEDGVITSALSPHDPNYRHWKDVEAGFTTSRDGMQALFASLTPQQKTLLKQNTYKVTGWLEPAPAAAPAPVGLYQQRLRQMAALPPNPFAK